jgi:hypothetical protein
MDNDQPDKLAIERFQQLQQKRREILALPANEALERILEDAQPAALVHSFPEPDFYFLVQDIGPEDSLALLSLASDRQWDYLIDLETWQRDRIEIHAVTRWMNLLLEADPQRFIRWFLNERLEFVEFYLFNNIEVRIREHDQDPSDFGDEFFSLDGVYFIRITGTSGESEFEKFSDAQRRAFITKLTEQLAAFDHLTFQNVLLEATHLIPSETEEDCYRWRKVRLAEKGFLPFDEAVGIYQPITLRDVERARAKIIPSSSPAEPLLPVPLYPINMLKQDNYFTRALSSIAPQDVLHEIQAEFASLCNQIIVADHKTIRGQDELRQTVRKACGYLSIGLERLSPDAQKADPHHAAALITRYPLTTIFRLGFGRALKLKWRAEKWLPQCWFARTGLRLTFWGEQWMGVLGGLLIKKPLFYDNYKSGVLYREFESLEDIQTTENSFSQIKAVDDLLSLMTISLDRPLSYGFLTYKNLILTLWARHYLQLEEKTLTPLALKEFIPFFEDLLPGRLNSAAEPLRKIDPGMKALFLKWLAVNSGLMDFEITERLGPTLEVLFQEIENDLGRVATKDLDPRYVHLFLLKRE